MIHETYKFRGDGIPIGFEIHACKLVVPFRDILEWKPDMKIEDSIVDSMVDSILIDRDLGERESAILADRLITSPHSVTVTDDGYEATLVWVEKT